MKMNIIQKILGITAMCVGLTRGMIFIDNNGITNSFLDFSYYFFILLWVLGAVIYISGEKK